jgi:hypothetical protein
MAKSKKNSGIEESVLPDPASVELSVNVDVVNATAIRRGKVRELMRMGYNLPSIQKILKKGIKLSDGNIMEVDVSDETIKYDIKYVRQEMASSQDENLLEIRADILDKLKFLYERAINEYISAKGQTKNSFLNTALSVMSKIVEVEGVKSPERLEASLSSEGKMSTLADQLNLLGENERNTIITTIRAVIEKRKRQGSGNNGIPDGTSRIQAQASDNEGISGE